MQALPPNEVSALAIKRAWRDGFKNSHAEKLLKELEGGALFGKYTEEPDIDHEHTNLPVCPHCGKEVEDTFELGFDGDEGEVEVECYGCKKEFIITQHIRVSYSTFKN